MTKYQYFLQMFMLFLSRSKIATIQKVVLSAKKSQQKGSVLWKSFCAGKTSPNGGTPLSALTTTRWELHKCKFTIIFTFKVVFYIYWQFIVAPQSCLCSWARLWASAMPNMKFKVQVRLLAEKLSDQPESHSDKDKEVAYTLYIFMVLH